MTIGDRVRVTDAANLPCEVGAAGVVVQIRESARDFPIGVCIDGGTAVEWFRTTELQPEAANAA